MKKRWPSHNRRKMARQRASIARARRRRRWARIWSMRKPGIADRPEDQR